MGAVSNLFTPTFAYTPSGIFHGHRKYCLRVNPLSGSGPSLYFQRSVRHCNLYFCNTYSLSVSPNRKSTVQSESVIPFCTQDESSHQTKRKQTRRDSKTKTIPLRDKAKVSTSDCMLSDVEIEVLRYMENSSNPYKFPTKEDLLRAGRADLVDAILSKGGWLSAGWDTEQDLGQNDVQTNRPDDRNGTHINKLSRQNKACECKGRTAKETYNNVIGETNTTKETSKSISSKTDRQRSWERVANLFGINSSHKKPGHYGETILTSGPNPVESSNSSPTQVPPACISNNMRVEKEKKSLKSVPDAKQLEKKQRTVGQKKNATLNQSLERINEHVDKRKEWLMKVKSTSPKKPSGVHKHVDGHGSITSRIQGLESELMSTLHLLQSGRHALAHDSQSGQDLDSACQQIQEASDSLEFRETEVLNKRGELRKARAELTASEGKLAVQLIEFQRTIDEKEKRLEEARKVMKMFRTARIVWPNPAVEVLVAGSFDGWSSKRKMQKSSAGVFITSLQLYPGRYEIKFIVNGEWKIDPNRPVTRDSSGFENNVLIIN